MHNSQSEIINNGNLSLELCPSGGGSITRFYWHDDGREIDLMKPGSQSDIKNALAGDPRGMANFPLVPYCGRIDHGKFTFDGQEFTLTPNFHPEPHAIHGDGWKSAWQVDEQTKPNSITLSFDHSAQGNVMRYTAKQIFTLSKNSLRIDMSLTNAGNSKMPVGIGMHPAFIRTPKASLQANVDKVWMCDDLLIPQELVDVPKEWDFTNTKVIADVVIDNNFPVWDGVAIITWPEFGANLRITASEEMRHFVVFSPPKGDLFCAEPVSLTADAFNLAARGVNDTGVRVLEPEESCQGSATFEVGIDDNSSMTGEK